MQRPGKIKIVKKKSMPERGRRFNMGQASLSGPVAVDKDRLEAGARNSAVEKGEQKDE